MLHNSRVAYLANDKRCGALWKLLSTGSQTAILDLQGLLEESDGGAAAGKRVRDVRGHAVTWYTHPIGGKLYKRVWEVILEESHIQMAAVLSCAVSTFWDSEKKMYRRFAYGYDMFAGNSNHENQQAEEKWEKKSTKNSKPKIKIHLSADFPLSKKEQIVGRLHELVLNYGNVGDSKHQSAEDTETSGVPTFTQLQECLLDDYGTSAIRQHYGILWDSYHTTFERPISLCYSTTLDRTCEELRWKYCTYLDRMGAFQQRAEILQCCEGGRSQETLSMIASTTTTTSTSTSTTATSSETMRNIGTIASPKRKHSIEEFQDPNEVKVVVNRHNEAIYFSREPIPSLWKGAKDVPMLKQVCIIPFKRDYLLEFNELDETELERIESVDMMRIIENGGVVNMVMTHEAIFSVDTEHDRAVVEMKMAGDRLMSLYGDK
jgi:hypothetical protein